jgi:hypothetical protein
MADVRNYALAQARAKNPKSLIEVTVESEIDENGQVHWLESVTTENCGR